MQTPTTQSFSVDQITEKEFFKSLKSMQNDKPPRNDGISDEYCESFLNYIKKIFFISS